jgi:ribosomal protein S18 acetylase RimI-like enzyme
MNTFTLRPYERKHQQAVLDLLFHTRRTHVHLDWYRTANWLDTDAHISTAWDNNHLLGVMGVASVLNGYTWMRLLAVDNASEPSDLIVAMWQALLPTLLEQGMQETGVFVLNRWVTSYLAPLKFNYQEDVITMSRVGVDVPTLVAHPFVIHNAYLESLAEMITIDHAAFTPAWQMSRDEMRHAQRQSGSCTIALHNNRPIGYQITTRHQNTAHLARLAVLPEYQGRGVGRVLLDNMIQGMNKRGVRAITVNTQEHNHSSQHLYTLYGFRRNGYDLPVWAYQV